jgi:hypothetical protein
MKSLRNQYRRPRPGKGCRATGKKKKRMNIEEIMVPK